MFTRLDGGKKRVVSRWGNLTKLVLRQAFRKAGNSMGKRILVAIPGHRRHRPLSLSQRSLLPKIECSLGPEVMGSGVLGCLGRKDVEAPRQGSCRQRSGKKTSSSQCTVLHLT